MTRTNQAGVQRKRVAHLASGPALRVLPVLLGFLTILLVSFKRPLTLPFLNDDYLILDKVLHSSFLGLWKPVSNLFNWYRPWSRELHYWALVHLFGAHEPGFHLVSFGLWLADMALYFTLARRCGSTIGSAALSVIGAGSLALWSAPLLWVAGVQELWFLGFALAFMIAVSDRRYAWAYAFLMLALLSKEVAAVLPIVAALQLWLIRGDRPRRVLSRSAGFVLLVAAWAALHPTLRARMFGHLQVSPETVARPSVGTTFAKTLLAQFNLDSLPRPDGGWASALPLALVTAGAGVAATLFVLRSTTRSSSDESPASGRIVLFGLAWSMIGWSILFLPSIGWHPYYGAFGTLGAWLALSTILIRHRRIVILTIAGILVLRQARLQTPSWDWGTYWYQERAGSFLTTIRTQMFGYYPTMPHHARLYFANLPNNIGLVAADGPAFRVWYGDSTLKAGFYSQYAPRAATDAPGRDFFFRYGPETGLTEVEPGVEPMGRVLDAQWEHNQRVLASMFLHSGELSKAAQVYAKLWHDRPGTSDYALYAAGLYGAMGDSLQYRSYLAAVDGAGRGRDARAALPALISSARQFAAAKGRSTPEP